MKHSLKSAVKALRGKGFYKVKTGDRRLTFDREIGRMNRRLGIRSWGRVDYVRRLDFEVGEFRYQPDAVSPCAAAPNAAGRASHGKKCWGRSFGRTDHQLRA